MRSLVLRPFAPCLALAAVAASAAPVSGVRIASVTKDAVTIAVELEGPGAVAIRHGEAPLAWTGLAESSASGEHHVLRIGDLVPDTQYFYQLEIDGAPAGDVLTFRSGRSWAARDATILVTADLPDGGPGERELADRLFAETADAIVVLGAGGTDEAALRALHGRSMSDRLVLAAPLTPSKREQVSDVLVVLQGIGPLSDDDVRETCWTLGEVASVPGVGRPADVIFSRASGPASVAAVGSGVELRLDDAAPGGAPAHYARFRVRNGTLEATLHDATGAEVGRATLARSCKAPASKEVLQQAYADGELEGGGSSDLEDHASDCDAP